jgi:tetratricopeptide (TPR) repeat protein
MTRFAWFAIPMFCAAAFGAQPTQLDAGYGQMYNLQFAEAHKTFEEWQRQHPDDPMGFVSDGAAYLFSEFERLHILESEFFTHDQHFITDNKLTPDPVVKRKFDAALDKTLQLAARTPTNDNAMFAALLAGGLRSDYTALIDKRYMMSFKEMKASRQQAERLLAINPQYSDAWLAVGVENYMLSIKPLFVRWFLRMAGGETDRLEGIAKLKITAEKGRYLAPFARPARSRCDPCAGVARAPGAAVPAQPALPAGTGAHQFRKRHAVNALPASRMDFGDRLLNPQTQPPSVDSFLTRRAHKSFGVS